MTKENGTRRRDGEETGGPGASLRQSPLKGRRVLVTRAEVQGESLTQSLRDMGAEVLWIPTIRTVPVEPESNGLPFLEDLPSFRWIAFASPNAVRHFLDLLAGESKS